MRPVGMDGTVPVDLRLYGILDVGVSGGDPALLARMAGAAAAGGCTLLQYREKAIPNARESLARLRAIRAALSGSGVPLLVNDRVDLALAAGAEGVHLGQEDLHPAEARRLLGPGAIIGLTVKTGTQADELYRLPVDYACIGGVFATASKRNPDPPVGLEGLARIAFRARLARGGLPIGAIAGIDSGNAASVIGAGADGIALISALFGAPDEVEARARALRQLVDRALAARGAA
ncbi:thiamine-phosphate pyrophosphorylase [Methylobacterium sp. 4-46]|uniref:thiamine phosphate synthase n=1 Tax=unclassified Methylobacterium TaxID=2615210 RepID=UPI000152C0C3|nr:MULTISPECIES: thiamine phosphate synthase [Methylobacterium]ACA19269.1 thiamine-phosphate pyrophosphorylase [Methylobacterium sp. 4-46]WFT78475.1 thiamine phosphate synthase [Methylobacterium nodulans]